MSKCFPVVCLSASRYTAGGSARRHAFNYVPGSGDDHEAWAPEGFGPAIFWNHKERLLASSRSDLPKLMQDLLLERTAVVPKTSPATVDWVGKTGVGLSYSLAVPQEFACMRIELHPSGTDANPERSEKTIRLAVPTRTKDHYGYFMGQAETIVEKCLASLRSGKRVLLAMDGASGKNGQDVGVGLALCVLCACSQLS